jgi:hypothetical protein
MKRPSKKSVQNAIVDITTVDDAVEITTPATETVAPVEEVVVEEVQVETIEPEQIVVEEVVVEEVQVETIEPEQIVVEEVVVIEEPVVSETPEVVEIPSHKFQIRLDDKLFGVTVSNGLLNWQTAYDWADSTGNVLPDKNIISKVYMQAKDSFGIGEWWSASRVDDDKAWVIDFVKKNRSAKRVKDGAFAFYLTEI